MSGTEAKSYLNQYTMVLGIISFSLVIALFGRPADADDEFTPSHLRDDYNVWNSGTIDGWGGNPTGNDGSNEYMLDYIDAREEVLQQEMLDAIEEARDE